MGEQSAEQSGHGKWMALTAALLGWMFDGFEMGVFSMVGRPAVKELLGTTNEGQIGLWFGVITCGFLVGAATGGVVFGWLGDRVGRVRAMTLSILTYAVFTGACGLATEAWQIGALRFIAALGMGGEWSLGVALVMEIWPNRSRAFMAGLIGAAANVGYLLVGFASLALSALPLGDLGSWAADANGHPSWRFMMVLGTAPALLTFFIRLFVPESHRWEEARRRGATSGWAARDLLGVAAGVFGPALIVCLWAFNLPAWVPFPLGVRLLGTVLGLIVAIAGYTYPVIRYLQRVGDPDDSSRIWSRTLRRMLLGACLSGVALLGTWGSTQWAPSWSDKLVSDESRGIVRAIGIVGTASGGPLHALPWLSATPESPIAKAAPSDLAGKRSKEWTQIVLAVGAIIGTLLAAMMGDWFGRRPAYALLCLLSLASVYLLFLSNTAYGPKLLVSAGLAGAATASFYGWLPLYLPELFPTRVRATGQGFSYNFGRILAAVGVLQTGNLLGLFQHNVSVGPLTVPAGYPLACSVMSLIYVVGMVIIWFVPETRGKPLPD